MRLLRFSALSLTLVGITLFFTYPFTATLSNSASLCVGHDHTPVFGPNDQLLFITEEDQPNGDIIIYAKNIAYCPLTVDVAFPELINMETSVSLPYTGVVPARADKHPLLTISQKKNIKSGRLSYRYSFNYAVGDVLNAKHDDDFVYQLPFATDKSYTLGQGYNGRFSHQNLNSLDFNMEVGSKVCAARSGVVIRVKDDSDTGCKSQRCQGKANYIVVYHEDGTSARYIHLKHKGSKVRPGQKVAKGEVIGYSGNTGWSSGPHLHFEVNLPGKNMTYTVPTKFDTKDGIKQNLKEGVAYKSGK